jgi:hypothetical protein
MPTQKPRKPRLTDESNWRGDLPTEEEAIATNKALEDASREEDLSPSHYKVHSSGKVEKMSGNMIDPTQWGLGDIPEPEVLEDGNEAKVRITSVRDAKTKEGDIPYYRVMLEVPDNPLVKDFSYNVYRPYDGQTPKQSFNTKYQFQQFMKAFNMDMSRPFDPETSWVSEEAWCIVSMKEDKEYGKQNQVRKWILPK